MIDTSPARRLARSGVLAILVCGSVLAAGDGRASIRARTVAGDVLTPFAPAGKAGLLFFVSTDCPVSNSYAPVIQRVCREYGPRGVSCALVYEDVDAHPASATLDRQVRAHLTEYGYSGMPAAIDRDRTIARAARATITPEAFVVDRSGDVRYHGRIDNLYAALGKTRQEVTSHDLRDALEAVLTNRNVPNPKTEAIGCYITDPAQLRTHHHD
jgi:thiol-disulfide isomerase/thioredoxin